MIFIGHTHWRCLYHKHGPLQRLTKYEESKSLGATRRAVREDVASIRTRMEQLVFTPATASLAKLYEINILSDDLRRVRVKIDDVRAKGATWSIDKLGCDNLTLLPLC